MKITVVPASTKTGHAVVRALLQSPLGPSVTGIYRDPAKVPGEFESMPKFTAVKGDVANPESLDLTGSDAVVTVSPPQLDKQDPVASAGDLAANVKSAVLKAGSVKRLVYLSSSGAQFEHGTGEIKTNYATEQALKGSAPEVVFVRCAYFMENWSMSLKTLQADPPFFTSVVSPADYKIPMVSVRDIGKECAAQALAAGSALGVSPYAYDFHGPQKYSALDVKTAFETVLGKEIELKIISSDKLDEHFGRFLPPHLVPLFSEMTRSFLPGDGVLYVDENDEDDAEAVARGERRKGSDTLMNAVRGMLSSGS